MSWGEGPGWQGKGEGPRRCWPSAGGLQLRGPGAKGVMVCRLESLGGEQGRAGPVEEVEETETLDRPGGISRQPRPTQPCPVHPSQLGLPIA